MVENAGSEAAERILNARVERANLLAWELRKAEILRADGPLFFQAMAEELRCYVEVFNLRLGMTGDEALTYRHNDGDVMLGKRYTPILIRKVLYNRPAPNQVKVSTQVFRRKKKTVTEWIWSFDKEPGKDLLLDGLTFVECAHLLFDDIPELFV